MRDKAGHNGLTSLEVLIS